MRSILPYIITLVFLCISCSNSKNVTQIEISETAGYDRVLEYVNASVSVERELAVEESILLTNVEDGTSILAANINSNLEMYQHKYDIIFPVKIGANQTNTYNVSIVNGEKSKTLKSKTILSEDNLTIDNLSYKATFSTEDDKRGGQVNGIVLKDFNKQLLRRGHIAMHWAPNFSKTSSQYYFNLEDLQAGSKNEIKNDIYSVVKERAGVTDSVPEIRIEGRYEFYADLPYFLFESTMTVEKEVELNLLRNDEMTMDSLFTHLTYTKKDGSIESLNLYSDELDKLEVNHVTDDANWLAFYNLDKGYGFASIRLQYDNTNMDGETSPIHNPYTKITRSSNNGRYWNRVLSDTIQKFPVGSRYYERNAYLVFNVDSTSPEKEIVYYYNCLKNPLKVQVKAGL
ncbi:hypothetical protein [Aurantibacter sp.]|uniref:hypothetical protein n=1 Tax=Aurantibacter sp. TaxID=2807103 RepID=UPI003267E24B